MTEVNVDDILRSQEAMDALKRENEKLQTESGFLAAGARKLEARIAELEAQVSKYEKAQANWFDAAKECDEKDARIAALEKENALLIQAIETGNTVWCAECNLPVRCCRCVADRLRYRIAKLEGELRQVAGACPCALCSGARAALDATASEPEGKE